MRTDLFDFVLPEDRIALRPATPRDAARLLVVRAGVPAQLEDRSVRDLPELLRAGVDLYELSATRVLLNKRLDVAIPGTSLGRLHAKTAAIDRSMVFIGSMNLDPRSDSINTELGIIVKSPELAGEVMRVINISKLRSAYRVQFDGDGNLEWVTTDDKGEVILHDEPDTSFLLRLQSMVVSPFVPEQEL